MLLDYLDFFNFVSEHHFFERKNRLFACSVKLETFYVRNGEAVFNIESRFGNINFHLVGENSCEKQY